MPPLASLAHDGGYPVPLSLYEKVSLNFGSGVIAVALVGVLSYVSLGKLPATSRAVGDTEAVLEQIDAVRTNVADAVITHRDFLLTGDNSRHAAFGYATERARRSLDRLRTLTLADTATLAKVDSLRTVIDEELRQLNRVADIRRRAGVDSASAALRNADVVAADVDVAQRLVELRADQRVLLAEQTRGQAERASDAAILLAIGLLVSFIAAALALSNIRRYIAERRQLELQRTSVLEQEQAARAAAEEANRAKTDFLRMMSHELRTPLTAIQGYLELLEMGIYGPIREEQLTILKRIESNERHLLAIINDLLDFARVDARRVELRLAPVPVREIRLAVEPLCRPQVDAKQLEYSWQLRDEHAVVRADREKVHQIVLNLVSNACKFTPMGGRIDVSCVPRERTVEIRVTDTGPGVPPHKLDAIFEPFVQLDNGLNRATPGTGLGLSISRELARAMGGDLAAVSTPGAGATFVLTLPRGDVESELLRHEPAPAAWETSRLLF